MEPAIYEKLSVFLWDYNIVLLAQISDDLFHRCRAGENRLGVHRLLAALITAFRDVASAANPESLYLLQ